MRISDWSSDVCSSDLPLALRPYETLQFLRDGFEGAGIDAERARIGECAAFEMGGQPQPGDRRAALLQYDEAPGVQCTEQIAQRRQGRCLAFPRKTDQIAENQPIG